MKNVSSASLIFFCLSASASALDLTADPAHSVIVVIGSGQRRWL
ncbi:Capsular polysaccharide export system periplasmic protein KpsD [Cronobacter sakazakii 701]|nr:Capsular polysaccharide export system periplasmic protein KpsD [Cronobacter sakazakii 701]